MKKTRILLVVLLVIAFALSMAGCYVISGRKMDKVKGTYKLAHYTYTPSYERKEGYTPRHYDYINDEEYQYEDYLIVTGTDTGYYVHKEANAPAYVKEVKLSYEYNAEDSSKVEYVIYNDSISKNSTGGTNRLGINRNILNCSKSAFDYTQLITKKPMRTEDYSVRWEKVDNATDLSYAKAQLGDLKEYDYQGFSVRGIYELGTSANIENGELAEYPYQYFYYVIDTAKGATTAAVYYALKETPTTQIKKTVPFTYKAGDLAELTLDGKTWRVDGLWSGSFYSESDGQKHSMSQVSYNITDAELEYWIRCRMPATEEP
ncbi:MAG: hypothetical protein E7453_03075 [Ruminococcaceae bacterium]|nr:hypothetical protein [Oscillospiraceae bacterium]